MKNTLTSQYELVKSSREVLLNYCELMKTGDIAKEIENFGRGSIRNLLIHIANTYEFWLGEFALSKEIIYAEYDIIKDMSEVRLQFIRVNLLVAEFLDIFSEQYEDIIEKFNGRKNVAASPFKLFTHVITHEYHHKGQILSMGRHLGYIPPDTDVIR